MILVTGGTGILGSRLLFDLVNKGKKVRAIHRSNDFFITQKIFKLNAPERHLELFQNIEWIHADITDINSLEPAFDGITHVYHCAAFISFLGDAYKKMMSINVEGTENMVNLSLERKIEKFAHVSSIAAIGRVKVGEMITEDTYWKTSPNNTGYAISKYGAEREVWRGMAEGLNAVIVNPGVIIGPGDWNNNTSEMFSLGWRGMKFYTEGVNAFVDARDVSKALIALMESDISNERFILASENISFRQFFDFIADSFNKPRATVKVNRTLANIGWRLEALRSFIKNKRPTITKETARASTNKFYYSNEKIRKAIGMEFMPMKKSVEDTCKVFLAENSFN
ncbi:MAG: NAD-dependent epimerase/dehydratase family protein [Bacteroidota bacterium]